MPPLPAVRDLEPFSSAAGAPQPARAGVVLYVQSFLPTYLVEEVRALAQRGVAVRFVLPASYPRAAMWDHINGGARGLDVRDIDFHRWLAEDAGPIGWPAAALLARVTRRFPQRLPRLAARCVREGTLRHLLAAASIVETEHVAGIDRVHSHFATDPAQVGALVAEIVGVPFTLTTHAHDLFVPRNPQRLRLLLRRAAHVLTISEFNRPWVEQAGGAEVTARVRVLRLGVDIDSLPRWSPTAADFNILCTASGLGEKKGVPVLIEACRLLKTKGRRFRCEVCGVDPRGERLPELRRFIEERGLDADVRLRGAVPWQDVQALASRASVFVHPSVQSRAGDMDGIPVSLIEAMGIGVPVIASRLSGIPELVAGSTGLLVPPGNAQRLADALEQVMDQPEQAAAMAQRGRDRVRDSFELSSYVSRLLDVWAESSPGGEEAAVEGGK